MNVPVIRRLVLKDWYLLRWPILWYSCGIVLGLLAIAMGGSLGFTAGIVLVGGIVISVGIHLAMVTVVEERNLGTLPFVMSLPISPADYTVAKIVANLSIFLLLWVVALVGIVLVLAGHAAIPHGLVPLGVIVLGQLLLGYVLMLAVAIVSESMQWTIVAMIAGNLGVQATYYAAVHIPSIRAALPGQAIVWSGAALAMIAGELVAAAALVALTFLVQSRKTSFV